MTEVDDAPPGLAEQVEAPYGWMTDPVTGQRRPKKRPGKQRASGEQPSSGGSPSLDELKASGASLPREEDRAPGEGRRRGFGRGRSRPEPPAAADVPAFRAGPIAKGMNKLYRRAGRLVELRKPALGQAIVACTLKADEDDVTVGEAWEELAKTNPRVRAFLLKLLTGGTLMTLFTAHLPILMAVLLEDGIREKLPLSGLLEVFVDEAPAPAEPGAPQQPPAPGTFADLFAGLTQDDMAQMGHLAAQMMNGSAFGYPPGFEDQQRGSPAPSRAPVVDAELVEDEGGP